METHEFRGEWWLPSDPENRQAGVLKFSPEDGERLELFRAFDAPDGPLMQPWETNIILGETTEAEYLTLTDCYVGSPETTSKNTTRSTQTCFAQKLFRGAKLGADAKFDKIVFTTPHLERWGERSVIVNTLDEHTTTKITSVDPLVTSVDGAEIIFRVTPNMRFGAHSGTEYRQTATFSVEPEDPLSLTEFINQYIKHLQHFVSLAMGEPLHADEIEVYRIMEKEESQKIQAEFQRSTYTVPSESTHPNRINFTQSDIEIESALQRWFESADRAETLHDRYFSTEYIENMALENQFLSLVIGLETYHRRINPDMRFMSKKMYSKTLEQIFKQMPDVASKPRIRNLLESGIGNEPSLRDRLMDVVSEYEVLLSELMDIDETIRDARDLRHELAHGLSENFSFDRLATITARLKIIILIHFLVLVGVDESQIKRKVRRKHGSQL